jgi:hypothetical protein
MEHELTYADAVQLVIAQPAASLMLVTPDRLREYLVRHGWYEAQPRVYLPPNVMLDDVDAGYRLYDSQRFDEWLWDSVLAVRLPKQDEAWECRQEIERYARFVRVSGGNRVDNVGPFGTGSTFAVLVDILATTEEP